MPDTVSVECGATEIFKGLQTYYAKFRPDTERIGFVIEILFPPDFPNLPPFCRIVRPRMQFRTGHITMGGSVCAEPLTAGYWKPTMTMSHVLEIIHGQLIEGGAEIDTMQGHDYTEEEARDAHGRALKSHGWS